MNLRIYSWFQLLVNFDNLAQVKICMMMICSLPGLSSAILELRGAVFQTTQRDKTRGDPDNLLSGSRSDKRSCTE